MLNIDGIAGYQLERGADDWKVEEQAMVSTSTPEKRIFIFALSIRNGDCLAIGNLINASLKWAAKCNSRLNVENTCFSYWILKLEADIEVDRS